VDSVWGWVRHKTQLTLLWTESENPKCSSPFLESFTSVLAFCQPLDLSRSPWGKLINVAWEGPCWPRLQLVWVTIRDVPIHGVPAPSVNRVQLKGKCQVLSLRWWQSPVLHGYFWLWSSRKTTQSIASRSQRLLKQKLSARPCLILSACRRGIGKMSAIFDLIVFRR
jgi:hypothetical protein